MSKSNSAINQPVRTQLIISRTTEVNERSFLQLNKPGHLLVLGVMWELVPIHATTS